MNKYLKITLNNQDYYDDINALLSSLNHFSKETKDKISLDNLDISDYKEYCTNFLKGYHELNSLVSKKIYDDALDNIEENIEVDIVSEEEVVGDNFDIGYICLSSDDKNRIGNRFII